MGRFTGVLALLVAGVVGGALFAPAARSWAAPPAVPLAQDATHGSELFVTYGCYQCHGFLGQGAQPTGPRLAPNPIAFQRFVGIVYDPIDLMPRYSPEYVSEQDLRDIYAYLQSVPAPPSVENIPLLNP